MQLHQHLIPVIVFALCTVIAAVSHGEDDSKVREPLPRVEIQALFGRPDSAGFEAREAQIRAELQAIPLHPWAGQYYHGDGLGMNISVALAPESGIVYTWRGCLGLYEFDHGTVVETGKNRLRVQFQNKRAPGLFSGTSPELVVVPWGDRRYLIPAEKMMDFVCAVNLGREPRSTAGGWFLLRGDDNTKKVRGKPKLAKKFARFILQRPVEAKITAVEKPVIEEGASGSTRQVMVKVTIDRGKSHGIFPGMELALVVEPPLFSLVGGRVVAVRDKTAIVALTVLLSTQEEAFEPRVGWRLSTREMSVRERVDRLLQKQ